MSIDRDPDPLVRPLADDDAAGERLGGAGAAAEPGGEAIGSGETALDTPGGGGGMHDVGQPAALAEPASRSRRRRAESPNMLPTRRRRSGLERLVVRLIATCGIVGIGAAIAAVMVSNHSQGWLVGLVVSVVSVVLAALLWSSRML